MSTSTAHLISLSYVSAVISSSSLQDITSLVGPDGRISFRLPKGNGQNYTLVAYYLFHSQFREVETPEKIYGAPQSPVVSFVPNGSWVVDHFSAKGAQITIDFWENYLINGSNTKQLLRQVGNYVWEDSMGFGVGIYVLWTPQLPSRFLANRGYTIGKYMPLIYTSSHGNGFATTGPSLPVA